MDGRFHSTVSAQPDGSFLVPVDILTSNLLLHHLLLSPLPYQHWFDSCVQPDRLPWRRRPDILLYHLRLMYRPSTYPSTATP